ncbi:hypothetical protein IMPR6_420027 [Imperialibacter sp. EC-SDR9]|nr:hypothetical protein IMPERIA89_440027 [Imperialibacter sp. 89]CAD5299550.1 hypothetical protein IMPERIA75_80027 [Imperialibacter sp. 75]VVT27545.1 hypothetical protein IMPR6_420027 [Imperialibacter sp. EC-SDR9]
MLPTGKQSKIQSVTMHVDGTFFPYLDEGSTPSGSTVEMFVFGLLGLILWFFETDGAAFVAAVPLFNIAPLERFLTLSPLRRHSGELMDGKRQCA